MSRYQAAASAVAVGMGLIPGCGHLTSGDSGQPGQPGPVAASLSATPFPTVTAPGSPALPLPEVSSVDGRNPDAVALAGVQALEQFDTAVDVDPNDTARRAAAAGWLTPAFAQQVRTYRPVAAPGATWSEWAAHRAYVQVTTSLAGDEHPPDSATTAHRQVAVQLHPVGRDGWTGPAQAAMSFVTLSLLDGQWRLASAQTS
jgi:hypothetical protein